MKATLTTFLTEKVKPFYDALMAMKDEARFHTVGFSTAGPYNHWLVDIKRLKDETDELELLRHRNVSVTELLQLGMDYLASKGAETRHTREANERFDLAFASQRGETKRYEPDREALARYLSEQFDTSPEQIGATLRETLATYIGRRSVRIPEHMRRKGELIPGEREDARCRADLQCWGDRHAMEATFACQDHVENLALYGHEWTDGILEPKFSHLRWKDSAKGVITYIGDKIKFESAYGVRIAHRYRCDYDAPNKQVLDVGAEPEQL